MKRLSTCTAAFACVLFALLTRAAGAAPGDVHTSFDAPCKYPAGLAAHQDHLFLLDWREGRIYQIGSANGKVEKTWAAPALRPSGLAFHDGKLFISDDHSGRVFALRLDDGLVASAFEAPGPRPTGLAWAGDALFLLEAKSAQIYKVDPDDGTILGYFPAPCRSCSHLTFDGRHLWVSNRIRNELYMVDPASGMVLAILDAPGPYAAGVAWLDGYLWNVDFQTRKLYQLVIHDQQNYRLWDPRVARVEYLWSLYNYGPAEVNDLSVNLAIPARLPNQQLLSDLEYSTPPARTATDRWGQRCALFHFATVPSGQPLHLSYSVKVKVWAIRYLIDPDRVGPLDDIPPEIRRTYTADGSRYRISSPYIQKTVKRVVGDERNPYWIARKVYDFIIERLHYQMIGGWDVPEVVLKRGSGSCSEYTFAFIALCRAAGLPARYQGSIVVRGDDASIDEAFHRWAQVYLPGYGWIPIDANRGDAKAPADQARGIGELANRFLITTCDGGGSEYLHWSYNSYASYKATGYCKVQEENLGFWEPLKGDQPTTAQPARGPAGKCRP